MNDIDKAIEYYHDHNGDEMSINFIYVSICLTLKETLEKVYYVVNEYDTK